MNIVLLPCNRYQECVQNLKECHQLASTVELSATSKYWFWMKCHNHMVDLVHNLDVKGVFFPIDTLIETLDLI